MSIKSLTDREKKIMTSIFNKMTNEEREEFAQTAELPAVQLTSEEMKFLSGGKKGILTFRQSCTVWLKTGCWID